MKMDILRSLVVLLIILFASNSVFAEPDEDTEALLHFEGAQGSTTFTDSTGNHTFVQHYGGISFINTVNFKYGTSSVYFPDGNNNWIYDDKTDLEMSGKASGTIEMWIYQTKAQRSVVASITNTLYSYSGKNECGINADGSLFVSGLNGSVVSSAGIMKVNQWYHIAFVKNGSQTTIYQDGKTVAATTSDVWSYSGNQAEFCVGGSGASNQNLVGYIDEFRFSNIARYTEASFTPPTNGYVTDLDIKTYYTGTGTTEWPNSSLGGAQTDEEVATFTNNIFDWITEVEAQAGDTEYRAIDVKNDSITDYIQNLVVWLRPQATLTSVAIAYDSGGTQSVPNESTAPDSPALTWSYGTTRATGVTIGTLAPGAKKRIWLRRIVPAGCETGEDGPTLRFEGYAP